MAGERSAASIMKAARFETVRDWFAACCLSCSATAGGSTT